MVASPVVTGAYHWGLAVEWVVFCSVDGWKTVILRADDEGSITYLLLDSELALERIAWYEAPWFNLVMLGVGLAGLLSALAAGAIGILARRRLGGDDGRGPRLARWWRSAYWALPPWPGNGLFGVGRRACTPPWSRWPQ